MGERGRARGLIWGSLLSLGNWLFGLCCEGWVGFEMY